MYQRNYIIVHFLEDLKTFLLSPSTKNNLSPICLLSKHWRFDPFSPCVTWSHIFVVFRSLVLLVVVVFSSFILCVCFALMLLIRFFPHIWPLNFYQGVSGDTFSHILLGTEWNLSISRHFFFHLEKDFSLKIIIDYYRSSTCSVPSPPPFLLLLSQHFNLFLVLLCLRVFLKIVLWFTTEFSAVSSLLLAPPV